MKSLAFAFGLTSLFIGLSTCIGYVINYARMYRWTDGAYGMAPNTGIAVVCLGIGLCIVSSRSSCLYVNNKTS